MSGVGSDNRRLSASFRTYLRSSLLVLFRLEVHTEWIGSSYRLRVRFGFNVLQARTDGAPLISEEPERESMQSLSARPWP
jgi:hypothetical protein